MRLTEREIDRLVCPPGQRDKVYFDDTQKGLAVRVTATGGKSFLAQYTIAGQKRRVPLGATSAISLAKAREAAEAVMGDKAHGIDAAAVRKAATEAARRAAERDRLTFGALVDDWRELHLIHRRESYAREAVRGLKRAFAAHWNQPAENLDRRAVVRVLDAITKSGSPVMAGLVARYGRAAYGWALKRGTLTANPFSMLPTMGAKPQRERVLDDDELSAVWRAAEATPAPVGPIVRLLILSGQRREEVAGMTWAELSDDLATWTIGGERVKNHKPHIVPLSEAARAILRTIKESRGDDDDKGGLVFPGQRQHVIYSGWTAAKNRLDAASKIKGWVIHDLRRTVATGLQRLGVRLEVTEAVLNHVSGSRAGIVGVYQKHNWAAEKRTALDAWAAHVATVVEGAEPAAANVVRLAAAR